MEKSKFTEKESLALISQMIQQTRRSMAHGAGNQLLVWGWLCTVVTLAVFAAVLATENIMVSYGYLAIPVIGIPVSLIIGRHRKRNGDGECDTYISSSIHKVWKCVAGIFAFYAITCLVGFVCQKSLVTHIHLGWFTLGMLVPAIGAYITGVLLGDKRIEWSAFVSIVFSLVCATELLGGDSLTLDAKWAVVFAVTSICSMVVPGYIINKNAE